ncbi:MAG: HAD-IA family hydrolase [Bacteriovoracaceae bacterium]|nr:HAD-IA family hydrolase [Bacteriovoracaceae bacterium]
MKNVIENVGALLFDMDGTLVTSIGAVDRAWSAWAKKNNFSIPEVLNYIHGKPARDSIKHFAPHLDAKAEEQWMLEKELSECEGVESIKGASRLLSSLGDHPWAIVTSADRSLAHHRLGLAGLSLPRLLISINDVKKGKPDPEGYLMAAEKLKVQPSACVVFEDTPAGISAGKNAGMKVIGVLSSFKKEELNCEHAISDYSSLSFNRKSCSIEWNK